MAANVTRRLTTEIQEAITREDKSLDIFLIHSEGGDGKTCLLRQVQFLLQTIPGAIGADLIDLYHSEQNSSTGLSDAIAESFASTNAFRRYTEARRKMEEQHAKGLVGKDFEAQQKECAEAFQLCYDALSARKRIVLFLDTAERMRYEEDSVQRLCNLSVEGTTVKKWLLAHLAHSRNTVCVIAGRPEIQSYLAEALEQVAADHPHATFTSRPLLGFSRGEVKEFYEQSGDTYEALDDDLLDADLKDQLWKVTKGNPIRLNLALEALSSSPEPDTLLALIRQGNSDEIAANIDKTLINFIFEGEKIEDDRGGRSTLRYLVYTRRGLSASLLHALEPDLPLEECRRRLEEAGKRFYVKTYAPKRRAEVEPRYFLHDEMYQLCDTYMGIPIDDLQAANERIAAYCENAANSATTRSARQDYLVDSLIYRLRAAPQTGYEWFVQQSDIAIRAAEEQLDMRLHNEMLAFLNSPSPLDQALLEHNPNLPARFHCDAGAGWVKRLMIRGQNKEAIGVYDKLLAAKDQVCAYTAPDNALARADLSVYAAQAMIYAGEKVKAVALLTEALHNLGALLEDVDERNPRPWEWRIRLITARAHNNLGYTYWMNDGRFNEALEHFKQALKYLRNAGTLQEEYANVLDNMGRVYALVRERSLAETCVDEGLDLRRQLGREYRVALSLNSRAIVCLEFDQAQRGLQWVDEALATFRRIGTQRGVGLALITAGRIERALASPINRTPNDQREKHLINAQRDLIEAEQIFGVVDEPIRLVDAENELGAVYRDLAQLLSDGNDVDEELTREALSKLRRSVELANKHGLVHQAADSYEDMAQTYVLRNDFDAALEALAYAKSYVPTQYLLTPQQGRVQRVDEKQHDLFLALLGKVEFLRGRIAYQQCAQEQGGFCGVPALRAVLTHYLLAVIYLQSYYGRRENDRLNWMERQIFNQFKAYSDAELNEISDLLKDIGTEYGIHAVRVRSFFETTMGQFLATR